VKGSKWEVKDILLSERNVRVRVGIMTVLLKYASCEIERFTR
jgi:hypothetical protein